LPGLLLASGIVTVTHPLLDWTNNYGVRFLLPWNPRWFYGDFVFIIDPFIWMVLGAAGFLLTTKRKRQLTVWVVISIATSLLVLRGPSGPRLVFEEIVLRLAWVVGLIAMVTLYRRKVGRNGGPKIAMVALATVVIYCSGLAIAHAVALRQATSQASSIAASQNERVVRVAAMPTIANPAKWVCVMETERATYRFEVSLPRQQLNPEYTVRYEKPQGTETARVAEAARDRRAQVFLGFARFPVVRVAGEDCATQTLVQLADLRYTEPGRGRGAFSLDVPIDCPLETSPTK
jgi:inner membrane protein